MKISINNYASSLLVETKAVCEDKSFNQLLIEAMELLHEKYKTKVQYDQSTTKSSSKS